MWDIRSSLDARPAVRVAVVLAGALLLAAGPSAAQTDTTATLTGGGSGGSEWIVANDAGTDDGSATDGDCDTSAGLAILDATLDPDGLELDDAYDYGQAIYVNGEIFVSANPPGTEVAGGVGRVFPSEIQKMEGLEIGVEYATVGNDATMRTIVRIFNTDEEEFAEVDVDFVTNLGSDDLTTIEATSDGDTEFTTADRWVITSDGGAGGPVVTHVVYGTGSPLNTTTTASDTVFTCDGNEGILASYTIGVPPEGFSLLLFYNQLHASVEEALEAVTEFDTNPVPCTDLVLGLSLQDLDEILNWDFGGSCRAAGRDRLDLENQRPRLKWRWTRGEETSTEDFGDPTTDTDYGVCLFETRRERQRFSGRWLIPAGEGWSERKNGFRYKQKDGAPDGITKVKLKEGGDGKAKIVIEGRDLELPLFPLFQEPEVRLLLQNSEGACWESVFETPPRRNDTSGFTDRNRDVGAGSAETP